MPTSSQKHSRPLPVIARRLFLSTVVLGAAVANSAHAQSTFRVQTLLGNPSGCDESCKPQWMCPPLAVEGRVIGVREDPLAAYEPTVSLLFPNGVPIKEAPFVRRLMQQKLIDEHTQPYDPPADQGLQNQFEPTSAPSVQRILFDAFPINQHGLADWDALQVRLAAVDKRGRQIPVSGTAHITLYGLRQDFLPVHDNLTTGFPQDVIKIANWTRSIQRKTFNGPLQLTELSLPLTGRPTDHNTRVAEFGLLRIRMAIPGRGVVEATARVDLRQDDPIRDKLQMTTGSRFLADEATHNSRLMQGRFGHRRTSLHPHRRVFSVQP